MSDAQQNDTVEAQVENELPEGEQAVQDGNADAGKAVEDGKNEAPNPYKQRLEELEAKEKEYQDTIAKKDEALKNKNRALKELKGQKDLADGEDDDLTSKIMAKLEAKQAQKEFVSTVESFTSDADEKSLILKIREQNPTLDFKACVAIANADTFIEQRTYQLQEEGRENDLAALSAATTARGPSKVGFKSPLQRQAEAIVAAINPAATKHVGKYTN